MLGSLSCITGGEELFALPLTEYPDLEKTRKVHSDEHFSPNTVQSHNYWAFYHNPSGKTVELQRTYSRP